MMRICCVSVAAFVLLASMAGKALGGEKKGKGLFSNDEEKILAYLKTHGIPHATGTSGTPTTLQPEQRAELQRARALFMKGTPRLRLAIAEALSWAPEAMAEELWDACGKDDFETRHHLAGLVMVIIKGDKKLAIRKWLLTEAHPSHAPALLARLHADDLYVKASRREQIKILEFIRRLYRQKGTTGSGSAVREKGKWSQETIQEAAVCLLYGNGSKEGRDLVLEWMRNDSKKVSLGALFNMWVLWGGLARDGKLLTPRFLNPVVRETEFAESWLLSPYRGQVVPGARRFNASRKAFINNVLAQIANPDRRVRLAAVEYALKHDRSELLSVIKRLAIPALMREKLIRESREVCTRLKKERGKGDQRAIEAYDKALKNLLLALERPKGK